MNSGGGHQGDLVVPNSMERSQHALTKDILEKQNLPLACSELKWLVIKSARLLSFGPDVKTVIELSLDNSQSNFEFHPGDTIGIQPENDDFEVESLLERLHVLSLSNNVYTLRWIEAIANAKETFPSHIPTVGSLKEVFMYFVDIRRVLSKAIINALCAFTRDHDERSTMQRLCKDKELYSKEILQNNVSISTFLQKFPSCQPPVTLLLQHLPKLMPRPYSICNSSKIDKNTVKICFSVIKLTDMLKGVTTGWLEKLTESVLNVNIDYTNSVNKTIHIDELRFNLSRVCISQTADSMVTNETLVAIPAYLRQPSFRLPLDQSVPTVLIAAGTGIAPFIGFFEGRQISMKNYPHQDFGPAQLYYGCKYYDKDFLYKEQLNSFVTSGALTKLTVCCSRESVDGRKYVQDYMETDKVNLTNLLLNSPTLFYICGNNDMVKQVESFFCNTIKDFRKTTDTDAKNLMKDLKKQNKYMQDVWI